jgi:hypothetical protein
MPVTYAQAHEVDAARRQAWYEGMRYCEAIRGARAMRERAATREKLWPRFADLAWNLETALGIPVGWITRQGMPWDFTR